MAYLDLFVVQSSVTNHDMDCDLSLMMSVGDISEHVEPGVRRLVLWIVR